MIPMQNLPDRQMDPTVVAGSDLPSTVLKMNSYTSVILSNLGLALARLPENSPARANISRAMNAVEQLADMSLALNDKVHVATWQKM